MRHGCPPRQSSNVPCPTTTVSPATSTDSTRSSLPVARRVQRRRTLQLDALRDRDLGPPRHEAMAAQVHGERAGGRTGRGILDDAEIGTEDPALPARALPGDATDRAARQQLRRAGRCRAEVRRPRPSRTAPRTRASDRSRRPRPAAASPRCRARRTAHRCPRPRRHRWKRLAHRAATASSKADGDRTGAGEQRDSRARRVARRARTQCRARDDRRRAARSRA